jgi:hypothetical protein
MLDWPIDNASYLYLLLICVALGLMARWWVTRKRAYLIGLGAVAGTAGLVFLLTLVIDTDRKRIVRAVEEMVAGVKERNLDKTFTLIANDCVTEFSGSRLSRSELRAMAQQAVSGGGVKQIRLWGFEFEQVDPPKAVVSFNAKPFGEWATGAEYCGCRAEFRLDKDGRWRMVHLWLFKPGSTELLPKPY